MSDILIGIHKKPNNVPPPNFSNRTTVRVFVFDFFK